MYSSSLKCLLWGLQASSGLQLSVPFFSSSGWRRSSGTRRTTSGSSSWPTSLRASSSFSPNARSSIRRTTPGCSSRYTTPFIQSLQASLYYDIPSLILVKMEGPIQNRRPISCLPIKLPFIRPFQVWCLIKWMDIIILRSRQLCGNGHIFSLGPIAKFD